MRFIILRTDEAEIKVEGTDIVLEGELADLRPILPQIGDELEFQDEVGVFGYRIEQSRLIFEDGVLTKIQYLTGKEL